MVFWSLKPALRAFSRLLQRLLSVEQIPAGEWQCPSCNARGSAQKYTEAPLRGTQVIDSAAENGIGTEKIQERWLCCAWSGKSRRQTGTRTGVRRNSGGMERCALWIQKPTMKLSRRSLDERRSQRNASLLQNRACLSGRCCRPQRTCSCICCAWDSTSRQGSRRRTPRTSRSCRWSAESVGIIGFPTPNCANQL